MEIRNASRPHSPIRKKYLFNLTNPLFANPNPSELFEFLFLTKPRELVANGNMKGAISFLDALPWNIPLKESEMGKLYFEGDYYWRWRRVYDIVDNGGGEVISVRRYDKITPEDYYPKIIRRLTQSIDETAEEGEELTLANKVQIKNIAVVSFHQALELMCSPLYNSENGLDLDDTVSGFGHNEMAIMELLGAMFLLHQKILSGTLL